MPGDGAATVAGEESLAAGSDALAEGDYATALGSASSAIGTGAGAIGSGAVAMGSGATANGFNAVASADLATAVGAESLAVGTGATALGQGAIAVAGNSVAIGQDTIADREDAVSVGAAGEERQIIHVAAGTMATDAANMAQLGSVAAALGGGAGFSGGVFTPPSYMIQGNAYGDVGAAFAAAGPEAVAGFRAVLEAMMDDDGRRSYESPGDYGARPAG